jgi:MarR family transcriptional regulator, organic hydroperoxide resistance regulator
MGKLKALSVLETVVTDGELIPLERSVGYHVRQLAESWQNVMDRSAEAHGATISQWRYLRELWEEDALTVGDLTRRVGRQGPTTVVAVQLLEKAGLVTIAKSAEDRRKSLVRLTARGKKLAEAMSPLISDVNERAMSDLSDAEIRTFKRLIVRIQRTLDLECRNRNEWSERRTRRLAKEVGL